MDSLTNVYETLVDADADEFEKIAEEDAAGRIMARGFMDELIKMAENKPVATVKPPKPPPMPKPAGGRTTRPPVVPSIPGAKPAATPGGMTIKKIETPESRRIRLQNEKIRKQNIAARGKLQAHKQQVAKDKPYNQAVDAYNKANDAFNKKWGMKPRFKSRAERQEYYRTQPKFNQFYNKKTNTYIAPKPAAPAQKLTIDPNMGLEGLR